MDNRSDIVKDIIALQGSTTLFMESLARDTLKVKVNSQREIKIGKEKVIERSVNLYFDSEHLPVLYCVSHIFKDRLLNTELEGLNSLIVPIGKIFNAENVCIEKSGIVISQLSDHQFVNTLNVKPSVIFKKEYEYNADSRYIGKISEYFNEESLLRYALYKA